MINIRGSKDYMVALESVAMTDIVMNLFIFFFISFSLIYTFNPMKMSKIEVKLPKASTAVALEGEEKVVLTVAKSGQYLINEEKINPRRIKEALEGKLKENPRISVVMKVDGAARFNNVVKVLDIINQLNIQKISVAAIKDDQGDIQ